MTEITCRDEAQAVSRSQHPFNPTHLAPFGLQTAGTAHASLALPSLALMAEELRRLLLLCEAQARRLDELEAREQLSWPTRSAYAHLEIDP